MRILSWPVAYSVVLVAALVWWTFRAYHSPPQVEIRLERYLSSFVTTEVELDDCRRQAGGALWIGEASVPASPAFESETALVLRGLVSDEARLPEYLRESDCPSPRGGSTTVIPVFAESALVRIERRQGAVSDGEAALWNVSRLFRHDRWRAFFEQSCIQGALERFRLELWDYQLPAPAGLEKGGAAGRWGMEGQPRPSDLEPLGGRGIGLVLEAEQVELHWLPDGHLVLAGDLVPAKDGDWSGGRLRATVDFSGQCSVEGSVEGVGDYRRWLDRVSSEYRVIAAEFLAREPVDVELRKLELGPERRPRIDAILRHYDSGLRLGSAALEIDHVSGSVRVSDGSVRFDTETERPLRGELWRFPVQIGGGLAPREGHVTISLDPSDLRRGSQVDGIAEAPALWLDVIRALGLEGTVEGGLDLSVRPDGREDWTGELRFHGVTSTALPILQEARGSFQARRSDILGQRPSESEAEGKGKILLDRLSVCGLVPFAGEIPVAWSDDEFRCSVYLKTSSGGAEAEGPESASSSPPTSGDGPSVGSIFGSLVWQRVVGDLDLELRASGLVLDLGLLRVADLRGDVALMPDGSGATAHWVLSGIEIPQTALGSEAEALRFESGRATVEISSAGARIPSLRLLSPSLCLRAQGEIGLSGELNLLLFVATSPQHLALGALSDSSHPSEWLAVAGSGFQAYRVRGTLAAPECRPLRAEDAVFVPPP